MFLISFPKGRGNLDVENQRVRLSYLDVGKHLDCWNLLTGVTEPLSKANGSGEFILQHVY